MDSGHGTKYLNRPWDHPYPFAMSAVSHLERPAEESRSLVAVRKEFRDSKDGQCDLPGYPLQDMSFSPVSKNYPLDPSSLSVTWKKMSAAKML